MNKIEIKILNPDVINDSERLMVAAARLTQRGHEITGIDDFMRMYESSYTDAFVKRLVNMPHTTLQKFTTINIVVSGISRRFLAQITRHQNEVKFMSTSLQYSNYSYGSDFVVPYGLLQLGDEAINSYLSVCAKSMTIYKQLAATIKHDDAGYVAPQSLRGMLLISATPYQWKHMIAQRTCRRNSDEIRYVMLMIWEMLTALNPDYFSQMGPDCMTSNCKEGTMSCKRPTDASYSPTAILHEDYPLLR